MYSASYAQCSCERANETKKGAIFKILKVVFAEKDPALVKELYHLAIEKLETFCPKAATILEEAEPDALSYLDFPYEHHKRLRSNNVQERANRELKRRSRVVQVFPSKKSLIRMLGAVFSEMDEDWSSRKWFNETSIAKALDKEAVCAPKPTYIGTPEQYARKIIDLVFSDNQISETKGGVSCYKMTAF